MQKSKIVKELIGSVTKLFEKKIAYLPRSSEGVHELAFKKFMKCQEMVKH